MAFEEIEFSIGTEAEGNDEEENMEIEEGIRKLTTLEDCGELSKST